MHMGVFDFLFRKKAVSIPGTREINAINTDIPEGKGCYTGYRYTATGVFGYSFRQGTTEVFSMSSSVMPNPDVCLTGFGKRLVHKHYNSAITYVPGIRRNVVDGAGNLQAFFEFESFCSFRMTAEDISASVRILSTGWIVYVGTEPVAEIQRISESQRVRFSENGLDMESFFHVQIYDTADSRLHPYILAIPMLGF